MKAILAALALATLLPTAAAAASKTSDVVQAKAHFKKGTQLYQKARYRAAIAEFEAAYQAKPHAAMRYNIAQCHEKLGDITAALKNYHGYLREAPNAEDKGTVQTTMSKLEKRLAVAGVQQLLVYSTPPGAEVRVDGKTSGRTPFSTVLPHGTHSVMLAKSGYRTLSREVVLPPERSLPLDFGLEKEGSPPAEPSPASSPLVAATPTPAAAGTLTAPAAPAIGAESKLNLSPAPPWPLTEPSPPVVEPKKSRVWTWVALGAAAAAGGTAAYYGLSARSANNQLHDGTVRPQSQVQSLHDDAQSKTRTANIFLAAAGVAGAAGITLFFLEGSF